ANAEGGIVMASEVPAGSSVAIMSGTDQRLISASEGAARSAATNLGAGKPAAVLVFDCICRRIFLGDDYKRQVEAFGAVIGPRVPLIGWETYGEIALTPGQQSGWHNSTSVVAVLPD
ncbi:MAG TPA: FIST C-terminal domain-containing protein, partial [Polyangium sp.]|nr:FIST C-terminal domain-containing protein [Polyangium sp.]